MIRESAANFKKTKEKRRKELRRLCLFLGLFAVEIYEVEMVSNRDSKRSLSHIGNV